jgi:chromosome segregation ATPase
LIISFEANLSASQAETTAVATQHEEALNRQKNLENQIRDMDLRARELETQLSSQQIEIDHLRTEKDKLIASKEALSAQNPKDAHSVGEISSIAEADLELVLKEKALLNDKVQVLQSEKAAVEEQLNDAQRSIKDMEVKLGKSNEESVKAMEQKAESLCRQKELQNLLEESSANGREMESKLSALCLEIDNLLAVKDRLVIELENQ